MVQVLSLTRRLIQAVLPALSTAAFCLAVVGSLVAFPSVQPGMIGFWLAWHTWGVVRDRGGWLPLAATVPILMVKRVYWLPTLAALAVAMVAVAAFDWWSSRPQRLQRLRRWRRVFAVALWLCWLAMYWQWRDAAHRSGVLPLDRHRPVVCLGDSLTSGIPPHGGYPTDLQRLLSVPVVDLGQEGITIEQGQRKLSQQSASQLAAAQPQAVIIELGGHDFLKGFDRATTRARLLDLIHQVRRSGAEPILVEIPRGFMTDPYAGLERELAHQEDLELVSDTPIRNLVIWSPFAPPGMWMNDGHLSDDGLHPNAAGNRALAKTVSDALERVFGNSILSQPDSQQ